MRRVKSFPRQYRKKSVPAWRASIQRQAQQLSDKFQSSFRMFAGNSLQLKSSAPAAMHVPQKSQRHFPRKKSVTTFLTAPRPNFRHTINEVRSAPPPRPLAILAIAFRTDQFLFLRGDTHFQNRPAAAATQELRIVTTCSSTAHLPETPANNSALA